MATTSVSDKSNVRNQFKEILNSFFLFKMTKYKMNNDIRTSSQVTLTSYLTGSETAEDRLNVNMARNESPENGRNSCQCCVHNCRGSDPEYAPCNITIAKERDRTSSSRDTNINSYTSISELIIDNLDKSVCLCEKYRNGCDKACSRAACPNDNGVLEKTADCNGWHVNYSKNITLPTKDTSGGTSTEGSSISLRRRIARRARAACSRKMLLRRLPIVEWMPRYNVRAAISDMIAGITVGLTVIPQAIAYANVAGLPPQYGLYSSFMAPFVYAALGSCKDSPVGPTAIAAILTRENLHGLGPEFAVLLCFLSGCVELLMGILQLGFLIDFISGPVSVGFTSAAAIIIATTQVKDILGLSFPGGKFLQVWSGLYEHIGETRLWDAVLGISCIVVLLLLRKVKDINVASASEETSRWRTVVSNTLWFLSTTRNILVVVICGGISYYFDQQHQIPFVLTGYVKPGLPSVSLPPFEATVGNRTFTFMEMAGSMSSAIFVIPLLSILENIALAKVFSEGKHVDATQEMIALGLCNMASSLVDSMPVSGALSRGAVNHASGVQTTFGGVYTGILVLVSLQFFTPYFYYIPKASLAAVIIAAVVFMMELHVFKPIWRTKKLDIIPALVTFVSCLLLRLELGIVLGIATNLLFLLYASARPSVRVSWAVSQSGVEYLVGSVDRSLAFPSVEFVRAALRKAAERGAKDATAPPPFVVDATHVQAADFTAAKGIKTLIDDFHARGQPLIFYNVKPSIVDIFRGVRPREFRHCAGPDQLDLMLQDLTDSAATADTTPSRHTDVIKTISNTVHANLNGRT